MEVVPTLLAGRLLVTADRSAALTSAGTRVVLQGEDRPAAMRMTNTVALSVGVYQGDAAIDSAGATLHVPALRATDIPAAGAVSRRADPLSYTATDRWDRRYLAAVLISPLFLLAKKRQHFLTVGYSDQEDRQQAMIFKINKDDIRSTLVVLEARTGRKVEFQDDDARKSGKG